MKAKKYIKRFITIVSLVLIPCFILITTQNRVDHNTLRIEGFYQEEPDSLDVVFVGSSEVFTGFSPALAYGKYGFTSYHYAIDSNFIDLFKYEINEVLRTQKPKVLLIETAGLFYDGFQKNDQDLATMRKFSDVIPISENKIDLIDDKVDVDKLSYYIPSILYHGDYSNLNGFKSRFSQKSRGYTYLKGVTSTNTSQKYDKILNMASDNNKQIISKSLEQKIKSFLEFCAALNTKVVFMQFPHRITTKQEIIALEQGNYIESFIREKGFDFINMNNKISQIGLNPQNDFYSDSHLNADGQVKLTKYISDLLISKYQITNSILSENNKKRWNTSYEYITRFYKYYSTHKNDEGELWWSETPELLDKLESIQ